MNAFDLLILGDCNPDLILTGEEIEPKFGQAERLAEDGDLTIGGSGSIVACGAARLGLRTSLVSVVGDDLLGRFMVDALGQRGVDTSAVKIDRASKTGITVILDRGDDRAIVTFPGTIQRLSGDTVDRDLLSAARHVHISSFFLQTRLVSALPGLLEETRQAGASTSIDPNWDPRERWNGGLKSLLPQVDILLPNGEEATRIAQAPDPTSAARELANHGPVVAVKLGGDGALAVGKDLPLLRAMPVPGLQPIDTIGAGDSFDAGFLTGRLNGWTVQRSLELACVCGGLSTRSKGGTAGQPSLDEALSFMGEPA